MKYWYKVILVQIVLFNGIKISNCFSQFSPEHPNIILIHIDDLNDYTNYLEGHPQAQTPNITALAQNGVSFTNAYCIAPGCAPSRTSMLSGKDCYYTKVYNNEDYTGVFRNNFNAAKGNATVYTIPELLKNSGLYYTYAIGKIFHSESDNDYDKTGPAGCTKSKSWNRRSVYTESPEFINSYLPYAGFNEYAWGIIPDSLEKDLVDYRLADTAIQFIEQIASGTFNTCDKAFFLALGIHRPHTPRLLPQKYFLPYLYPVTGMQAYQAMFNTSNIDTGYNGVVMPPQPEVRWADYYALPEGGLARSIADAGDQEPAFNNYLNSIIDLPIIDSGLSADANYELLLESERARYVLGYLAAANYVDAQIGRILDALESHPELFENTIVILTSDHGYSLGEKKHYTKWSLWDTDIRIPLVFSGPGIFEGGVVNTEISQIDMMPTICEIAGVTIPDLPDGSNYEDGSSFRNLLLNPLAYYNKPVISSYKKSSTNGSCYPHYSVRQDGYHYIRYHNNNNDGSSTPCEDGNTNFETELYYIGQNREVDPYEWNNIAGNPSNQPIINYLETFLPGNYNYLKKSMDVNIIAKPPIQCYLKDSGKIILKSSLLNENGSPVSFLMLKNYKYTWQNNATAEIKTGLNYTFNLNNIPADFYATNSVITFYLTVTQKSTGNIVAFKKIEFALNPLNKPEPDFTVHLDGHVLTIDSIYFNGSYTNVNWNFGDGAESSSAMPLNHLYDNQGHFPIQCVTTYGNNCSTIIEKPVDISYVWDTICSGQNYFLPDSSLASTGGQYNNIISNISGYDSLIITNLYMLNSSGSELTLSACNGTPVILPDGSEVYESGTYNVYLVNSVGCDSIITIFADIIDTSHTSFSVTICPGDTVQLPDGTETTIPGTYTTYFTNFLGCDSIVETTINFIDTAFTSLYTVCSDDSIQLPDGSFVSEAGTYITYLNNYLGCDSTITTILNVIESSSSDTTIQICSGQSVILPDSSIVSETGTYLTYLTNYLGCDSIISSHIVVIPISFVDTTISFFEGEVYSLPDSTLTSDTGFYLITLTDIYGCDSILNIHLIYTNPDSTLGRISDYAFLIYPNPVKQVLTIQLNLEENEAEIQLYSISGQLISIYQWDKDNSVLEIPMQQYAASVYIIRITGKSVFIQVPVIKID